MSRKIKLKRKILGLGLAAFAPFSLLTGVMLTSSQTNGADSDYATSWSKVDSSLVPSASFDIRSGNSQEGNTLANNWEAYDYDTNSKGMIINTSSPSFGNNISNYYLKTNPGTHSENPADPYILMINSKTSNSDQIKPPVKRAYKSKDFTLKSNSYYRLSIDVKTSTEGWEGLSKAYASVYLDGLTNEKEENIEFSYTYISGEWETYNFFVATGNDDQTVNLKLYLGATESEGSLGVAFFDDIQVEQYSQNAFVTDIVNYRGYNYVDNYNVVYDESVMPKVTSKFLVEGLQSAGSSLMDSFADYNLDFESQYKRIELEGENNENSSNWFIPSEYNTDFGHAYILDVRDKQGFEGTTGYDFVGNDFSFDMKTKKENSQAIALFTDKNRSTKVGIENKKDFLIKAHGIYKFSMRIKVSELTSGSSFYVNLIENDRIYDKYGLNKEDENIFQTSSKLSIGYSSNSDNEAINKYTEVAFYVKGRNLYDSYVNLQLLLGNSSSDASGCVVVDNIKIETVSSDDIASVDNLYELEESNNSDSEDQIIFSNASFNNAEVSSSEFTYPLVAKDWTLTQSQNDNEKIVGGVILLQDNKTFEEMYSSYSWGQKTSYPGNPVVGGSDRPNNVYMLHNGEEAYQSVKSQAVTLKADGYYTLTFDYFTQSYDFNKKANPIVEIIDEDGIVLYKDSLTAQGIWSDNSGEPVKINFHTAKTTSHNINVIIYLGEENNPVKGTLYLDNFEVETSSENEFERASHKIDLSDYMLKLDPEGKIGKTPVDSPAYVFEGTSGDFQSGIVSGKENVFGETYEDNNLLFLSTRLSPASGKLNSKYSFKLSKGYYKLTFSLKTSLSERIDADHTDDKKDHKCEYGVKVGLSNFEQTDYLLSSDKFNDYTIYLNVSSDSEVTSKFQFALEVDKHMEGIAYLTNIDFQTSSAEAFANASSKDNEEYKKTIFTSNQVDAPEENPNPDDKPNNGSFNSSNWILIPSIITSVAVVVAIIGWALRHVKIKKIQKTKEESYDRKVSLNQDEIIRQASKERDEELAKLKANLADMEEQKKLLEDDHKQMIKDARLSSKGKITKDTEREFKSYASKLARLQQKIDILKEQIVKVSNPEYLIAIEKRVASDETKRQKEIAKKKD